MIDYGSIVFKDKKRYKAEQLFPEIDELGVRFYKTSVISIRSEEQFACYFYGHKRYSFGFVFNGIKFKVKRICDNVFIAKALKDGYRYTVIFGYGIDNNREVWDKIKIQYLGKYNARKIDNVLRRYDYQ